MVGRIERYLANGIINYSREVYILKFKNFLDFCFVY